MGYKERQEIIAQLQELRGTKIVAHINSDRRVPEGSLILPGLMTKLGTEAQPFFYDALKNLGRFPSIDLFLYTSGGQTDSVWPLVSLLREFGDTLNVMVPYKSHSAGTLICLGANTIVLGEASELSPVDPSTGNQFNPVDEINPKIRKGISVEEVTSYFDLAKNPAKEDDNDDESGDPIDIKEVDQDLAFKILAEEVHPIALGNVNRSHTQIRELATRLLKSHYNTDIDTDDGNKKINNIVNSLTQGRYSHTDILNRKEVQTLLGDDIVKFASDEEQDLMIQLYEEYANALSIKKTFVLQEEIGDNSQTEIMTLGAFIETENISLIYHAIHKVFQRSVLPQNFQINIQPNQPMPLIPGFPREINVELREIGWTENADNI